jgi:hypothetical protein
MKNNKWRKTIFKKIFSGEEIQDNNLFLNANLKGLRFIPYPNHILEMKSKIEKQVKKTNPD